MTMVRTKIDGQNGKAFGLDKDATLHSMMAELRRASTALGAMEYAEANVQPGNVLDGQPVLNLDGSEASGSGNENSSKSILLGRMPPEMYLATAVMALMGDKACKRGLALMLLLVVT